MRAYVLCGGFGTRLRSVLGEAQKALVAVQGEPFLARVLRQLAQAGIKEVVLCGHYRADQLAEQLEALAAVTGLSLSLVVESDPLGTGGALLNALRERPPCGRYLVLNADTFLDAEAYRLAAAAEGEVLVGVRVDDRSRYGSLAVAVDGQLLSLREKGLSGPGLVNAGVYGFEATACADLPVQACSMECEVLPHLIERNGVQVVQYTGSFIDIGTPKSLSQYIDDCQRERGR